MRSLRDEIKELIAKRQKRLRSKAAIKRGVVSFMKGEARIGRITYGRSLYKHMACFYDKKGQAIAMFDVRRVK